MRLSPASGTRATACAWYNTTSRSSAKSVNRAFPIAARGGRFALVLISIPLVHEHDVSLFVQEDFDVDSLAPTFRVDERLRKGDLVLLVLVVLELDHALFLCDCDALLICIYKGIVSNIIKSMFYGIFLCIKLYILLVIKF